ncbi:MAG TPA: cyclopropane-fatty-acyl-phospholipid synthase family protein [Acidimicrobiales bacterium]|nr:cyclopropane-fatty-acyl-phospholipid synthase family protein [Acidimicrobiales bacterium]
MATGLLPPVPSTGRHRIADAAARRALALVLGRIEHGAITLVDGGERRRFGARDGDRLQTTVTVTDPAAYRALVAGGLGFARGYVEGWWGTDDLVALLRIGIRNLPPPSTTLARLRGLWRDGLPRRPGPHQAKARDREDIVAHYDLGDDFFALFLDETLTYSCGIFERDDATMAEASQAKLERICRKLELGPDDHVIEIGSGWGSFALHATSTYGCRVTTTTLSKRQYDHVHQAAARAGVAHLVTVLDRDYRDLEGTYDKLVSIEMIEAVGWRYLDDYFAACARLLRPGGRMALQAIVIDDRLYDAARMAGDFITRMVFPGSCIPSVEAITRSVRKATDLRMVELEDIGLHYVRTLATWREHFLAQVEAVEALGFDRRFVRLWDLYLAYCQAGFAERRISDAQIVLVKEGVPPRRTTLRA